MIVSRPLSPSEHFYRSRNSSGFYKSFQVTATYTNPIPQPLLSRALRKTVLDYHLLVCNVVPKNDDHWYVPLPRVLLEDLLECHSLEEFLTDGVINERFMKYANEFSFRFSDNKPLFRVLQLGDRNLSVIFEHTIADGLVGNYFHEILVENLALVEEKASDDTFLSAYGPFDDLGMKSVIFDCERDYNLIKNSLHPPIDDFVPLPRPSVVTPVNSALPMWPGRFPCSRDNVLAFKLINIDAQQARLILAKCKANKVTLTAYIEAVIVYSMQPIYGKNHYSTCKLPIALRRFIDPAKTDPQYHDILNNPKYKILGTSAHGGIAEVFEPLSEFSWELVQRIGANLAKNVQNKELMNAFFAFTTPELAIGNSPEFFEAQMRPTTQDTMKFSNLGLIDVPMYNSWSITNMVFSQDVSPPAADFMLNLVSTKVGGLNFVFSYADNKFEEGRENFDDILTAFRENLIKFAQ
ncbi:uncharacterized protein CANTADRAFT_90596 [Suhomyces tanzawaensis NRRL Y-17324]|uniref:Alcohol acetyltransferase n=1 Tax=Suhomyces tanzawaensis NRRL Y-17324 TaxID=984487 RepID=A0A1E4SJ54_9ASCO|nr:uncharacterized protein CANTADRAFT_90596 [Suhomyces tanzawaensis NRRL Y-17324]ODV79520.1 hypothetical protein CANTADRAFT_90596 [Suhomyces tanzawaensis NRRL Y-17324]